MCIGFDKIDEFVRCFDGTRYLVLLGGEKYDLKSGITYNISYNYFCL